jgi:uncharacterized FlaG/YvyC family protein
MESGLNIRPVQTTSVALVRAEPSPQRQVARTELPETQAVFAAAESQPVQYDQNDQQQKLRAELNSAIDVRLTAPQRKVDRDDATQELVFRTVSAETGRVVSQYPEDAILRQKAYAIQLRRAELDQALTAPPGDTPSDHVQKVA